MKLKKTKEKIILKLFFIKVKMKSQFTAKHKNTGI